MFCFRPGYPHFTSPFLGIVLLLVAPLSVGTLIDPIDPIKLSCLELLGFENGSGKLKCPSGKIYSFNASNLRLSRSISSQYKSRKGVSGWSFVQFELPTPGGPLHVMKMGFRKHNAQLIFNHVDLNPQFADLRGEVTSALVKYVMETLGSSTFQLYWKLSEMDALEHRMALDYVKWRETNEPEENYFDAVLVLEKSDVKAVAGIAQITILSWLNSIGYELDRYQLHVQKNSEGACLSSRLYVIMSK